MGTPKALLPFGSTGDVFLDRIVRSLHAGGVADVVIVTGADAEMIRDHIEKTGLAVRLVYNPDHDRGQLTSLKAGLEAVTGTDVSAAVVTLVDIPLFDRTTVSMLIEAHQRSHPLIVRPVSKGRHGHPVLFDRRLFQELLEADPESGAKAVVHAHRDEIVEVHVHDEGAFIDIDTPEDYRRMTNSVIQD